MQALLAIINEEIDLAVERNEDANGIARIVVDDALDTLRARITTKIEELDKE